MTVRKGPQNIKEIPPHRGAQIELPLTRGNAVFKLNLLRQNGSSLKCLKISLRIVNKSCINFSMERHIYFIGTNFRREKFGPNRENSLFRWDLFSRISPFFDFSSGIKFIEEP